MKLLCKVTVLLLLLSSSVQTARQYFLKVGNVSKVFHVDKLGELKIILKIYSKIFYENILNMILLWNSIVILYFFFILSLFTSHHIYVDNIFKTCIPILEIMFLFNNNWRSTKTIIITIMIITTLTKVIIIIIIVFLF